MYIMSILGQPHIQKHCPPVNIISS